MVDGEALTMEVKVGVEALGAGEEEEEGVEGWSCEVPSLAMIVGVGLRCAL